MDLSFDPFGDLDRLTSSVLRTGASSVPVDLFRDGDRYVLNADLPGVDPGSIDVDLDGNLLTIRAERTGDSQQHAQWIARERLHGSYFRQFTLGDGLDIERISASYDNGVLSVIIPVSERARPRKISVLGRSETQEVSA